MSTAEKKARGWYKEHTCGECVYRSGGKNPCADKGKAETDQACHYLKLAVSEQLSKDLKTLLTPGFGEESKPNLQLVPKEFDVEKFKLQVEDFLRTEKASKELYAKWEKMRIEIDAIVAEQGTKNRPGTDQTELIIGTVKLQHQAKGNDKFDEVFTREWLKANFADAVKKIEVEVIDKDKFAVLKLEGKIPADVLVKMTKTTYSYFLTHFDLKEYACPSCKMTVSKDDRFCKGCGTKLEVK
jgi:hypothetical protein